MLAAKLDIQFTVEEKTIIGRIEKSTHELKTTIIKDIRRLEESTKVKVRAMRNEAVARLQRVKAIASTDDVRTMMQSVDMYQAKYTEMAKRYAGEKEKEIRAAE